MVSRSNQGIPISDNNNGHVVDCLPSLEDPNITQKQHRVVCLTRPYAACNFCTHSTFKLRFEPKEKRYDLVHCPRWTSEQDRLEGKAPESYIPTEIATCALKQFSFCPSCPSQEKLQELGIDKTKSGWVSRLERFKKEDEDVS